MSLRSVAAFLAALALVGLLAFGLLSKSSASLRIGGPAPARPLPRLDGSGSAALPDFRGRWVMVNFWASWCAPCRSEAPALEAFYRQHRGQRFTIVGIDTRDLSGDGRAFVRSFGISYTQLRDGDGARARDFGTTGVPENFLINPSGRLALIQRGPVNAGYLQRYVAPLIAGGSQSS